MAYWIFKCSPDHYRLADRLADPNDSLTWRVSSHMTEIGPGDIAFIWLTGKHRGIRAVLKVEDIPRVRPELESEQQYLVERDTQERLRVAAKLTHRGIDLGYKQLREIPGLRNLSVFRVKEVVAQGTNFVVTPEEGKILMKLL